MKRMLSVICAMSVLSLLLTSCGGGGGAAPTSTWGSSAELYGNLGTEYATWGSGDETSEDEELYDGEQTVIEFLKTKYADSEPYEYADPLFNLPRDFQFHIRSDLVYDSEWRANNRMEDAVKVFVSRVFTESASIEFISEYDEENGEIIIMPWVPAFDLKTADSSGLVFRTRGVSDWGNSSKYYLVKYIDFNTGEKLEKPLVTFFSVRAELDSPVVKYHVDDQGNGVFFWDKIAGAKNYIIGQVTIDDEGQPVSGTFRLIETITGTRWHAFEVTAGQRRETMRVPTAYAEDFGGLDDLFADLGWADTSFVVPDEDEYGEQKINEHGFYSYDGDYFVGSNCGFFVIAANQGSHSNISNIVEFSDFAPFTPFSENFVTDGEVRSGDDGSLVLRYGSENVRVPSVELAPLYAMVTMMDGTDKQFVVRYPNTDSHHNASIFYERNAEGGYNQFYRITTGIHGTPFSNGIIIEDNQGMSLNEMLNYLKLRENRILSIGRGLQTDVLGSDVLGNLLDSAVLGSSLAPDATANMGNTSTNVRLQTTPAAPLGASGAGLEKVDVYANSALVEYIAINFVNRVEKIPLKDFPEAADSDHLLSSASEAYFQNNSFIGGIEMNDMTFDPKNAVLNVPYAMSADEQKQLKSKVDAKIDEIIKQIITPGMNAIDKQKAINDYLCRTVTYDDATLKALMALPKGKSISTPHKYSQTAYGALINGKGICQSYAEAYMALCERAGLQSVMVTGVLNGVGGHAWNRTLHDGEWFTIDVTNNDSTDRYNEFFNMPDDIASTVLTEDKRYALRSVLPKFKATKRGYDYYSRSNMSTTIAGLEQYMVDNVKAGTQFNVVVSDLTTATRDSMVKSLQGAAGKVTVKFTPKIYLWVLRVQCA